MFKIEDLDKLKKLVKSELESELRITKAIYNGIGGTDKELYPYDYMLALKLVNIIFKKGIVDLSRLEKLKTDVKAIAPITKVRGTTGPKWSTARYDDFKTAEFVLSYYVPIEEVTEDIVKAKTKTRLTKLVMPEGYDEFTFTLDCRLMEQFKLGTLTMEQVVEGSKGECQL